MQHEVKVPVLAESISEARLLGWHKQPGADIQRGENLVDIETDKVTLEVPAPAGGRLGSLLKQPGELVDSQEIIALIDSGTAAEPPAPPPAATPPTMERPAPPPAATPPTMERPAPPPAAAPPTMERPAPPPAAALPTMERPAPPPVPGPAARNLLEEHALKSTDVAASGKGGRILKEDVLRHLGERVNQPAAAVQDSPAAQPPRETRKPMSALRRNIARRLLQAQHENAVLSTFNEVDMRPIMQLRQRYRESFEKRHGTKLGFMSFFTRAAIEALRRFPVVNASIDGNDMVYHEYYDIGIAISAPRGLVVPVLRDADQMSLADIEQGIRALSEKARKGGLSVEDLLGGTFTITNGGIFGSLLSTPIINPPQSAILGMHKIQERPIAEDGQAVIRPMMYLALSYDHRLIDGRDAVQFLVCIKELLEDPARMLLQA